METCLNINRKHMLCPTQKVCAPMMSAGAAYAWLAMGACVLLRAGPATAVIRTRSPDGCSISPIDWYQSCHAPYHACGDTGDGCPWAQWSLWCCKSEVTSCPANHWLRRWHVHLTGQDNNCVPSSTCKKGTRYVFHTDRDATCEACPSNTHQDEDNHRNAQCKSHSVCGPGQRLVAAGSVLRHMLGLSVRLGYLAGTCMAQYPSHSILRYVLVLGFRYVTLWLDLHIGPVTFAIQFRMIGHRHSDSASPAPQTRSAPHRRTSRQSALRQPAARAHSTSPSHPRPRRIHSVRLPQTALPGSTSTHRQNRAKQTVFAKR